ncbi:MAG: SDR family NAD(P)-dependent oxidoreductase [Kiritimatiellae bacterium]|nr:SDR family NAD(P)-dependent oxidoreductase [Kiritimatiellia bacterium]
MSEKTVLVTGCSSGIGLATACLLKQRGWQVIPTARKEGDLHRLSAEGFSPLALDMNDSASIRAAVQDVLERFAGWLGALVNNAGYGQPGAMEDLTRDAMRAQFETNLFGLQELTNGFIPVFRKQGYGRIVNVSSVVGRVALPFMGIYSASKFAVEAISDVMRVELDGSGIAVCLIEPGPIATSFGDTAAQEGRSGLDMERSFFEKVYRKRLARGPERSHTMNDYFRKPPEAVAEKILRCLESAHPPKRSCVTIPAHLGAFLRRFAPAGLVDGIFIRSLRKISMG